MANPEHVEIVKRGADAIWEWREINPEVALNLLWADLRDVDLREADLRKANCIGAILRRADLRGADLRMVALNKANLREADLSVATLEEAILKKADLTRADLRRSRLNKANLSLAKVRKANLCGASLQRAYASEADLSDATLEDAILIRANLHRSVLGKVNLRRGDLRGASVTSADLCGADLCGADFRGANLRKSNLSESQLRGLDLRMANLYGANLSGAHFQNTLVGWTIFGNLDLSNTMGLDAVTHAGPSTIGLDTLYKSRGKIPDDFLRGCGVRMMRGRAITAEEFERMLASVEGGLLDFAKKTSKPRTRPKYKLSDEARQRLRERQEARIAAEAPNWRRYLTGLWLSGLRLEESVALSWDQDEPFCVDLSGRHPRFRIYAEAQKGRRDQFLPMTPDFAEFILETPEAERHGPVFDLGREASTIGRIVSAIGKRAGVVVNKGDGKFATAHDLRRAFGTRWSYRVKPATLKLLMRHRQIETTMRYYVDQDADEVADQLWKAHKVGTSVGTGPSNSTGTAEKKPQTVAGKRLSECPPEDSNLQPSD